MIRRLRRIWDRLFPPKPIRLPGKWPWVVAKPLPYGSILINSSPPIIADGKGGVTVALTPPIRRHPDWDRSINSHRGARRPKIV